jgi:hypothetical protein
MHKEDTGPGITRYGAPDTPPQAACSEVVNPGVNALSACAAPTIAAAAIPVVRVLRFSAALPSPDARLKSPRHARIQTITIV